MDIQRLDIIGTSKDDTIYGGAEADTIYTGDGNDTVYAGTGADDIRTGAGNDFVSYTAQGSTILTAGTPFYLDGGSGIDTLSIDLSSAAEFENIAISGIDPATEVIDPTDPGNFNGINFTDTWTGGSIRNFEILKDVSTGAGNDSVTQLGDYDNTINTGAGDDTITPGLGFDTIDGGSDYDGLQHDLNDSNFHIVSEAAFVNAAGDRLILDYSSLTSGQHVDSSVDLTSTSTYLSDGALFGNLKTNEGTYETLADGTTSQPTNEDDFTGIEGVTITGSSGNDRLVGTNSVFEHLDGVDGERGGRDVLNGGAGDDILIGMTGDDVLNGGDGNDILQGSASNYFGDDGVAGYFRDPTEIDKLTGGAGADTFVLGDTGGAFYGHETHDNGAFNGSSNYAEITDFDVSDGDRIQLYGGNGQNYTTATYATSVAGATQTNTLILANDPSDPNSVTDHVVAILDNVSNFDLSASYVSYVDDANPGVSTAAPLPLQSGSASPISNDYKSDSGINSSLGSATPDATPPASFVTQDNNTIDLEAAFKGVAVTVPPVVVAPTSYDIQSFTQLVDAVAINDSGTIAGYTSVGYNGEQTGVGYGTIGNFTSLQLAGDVSVSGITASGQVIGTEYFGNTEKDFIYDPATQTTTSFDIGDSTQTFTIAANYDGDIVGWYYDASHGTNRVYYLDENGVPTDLPNLVTNISEGGKYISGGYTDGQGVAHGYIASTSAPDAMKTIDVAGATATTVEAVNDSGEAAGAYTTSDGVSHVFFYDGQNVITTDASGQPLGNLGVSLLMSINDAGQFAYTYNVADGYYNSRDYAAVYSNGVVSTLNVDDYGAYAYGINDKGDVVGLAEGSNGDYRFLATPEPSPPPPPPPTTSPDLLIAILSPRSCPTEV